MRSNSFRNSFRLQYVKESVDINDFELSELTLFCMADDEHNFTSF